MSYPVIALDTMAATAHVVTFNEAIAAMAAGTLFAIRRSKTVGLHLVLHGGVFHVAGVPTVIAEQELDLAPSDESYIYADAAGVVFATTTIPASWPGPLAVNLALYTITTDANGITGGTCHLVGRKGTGPKGPQGATGQAGAELWRQRKRSWNAMPGSFPFTSGATPGFDDVTLMGTNGTRNIGSTSFCESVAKFIMVGVGPSANVNGGCRTTNNLFHGGVTGGIDINLRWGFESAYIPSQVRWFAGLFDCSGGNPTNTVDPSALTNIIGIGADAADTLCQLMHNDGSGTATKTSLGASFPAKSVETIYDLRLIWAPSASSISYTFTRPDTGDTVSGTISSNIPASTTFLGWLVNSNTGTGGGHSGIFPCQVVAHSRY